MHVFIQDLLDSAGLKEPIYPGKKLARKYVQTGEYKSHCIVFDWLDSENLTISLKAGLSGRDLDAKELHKYPVSFQAPTYFDIAVNDSKNLQKDEKDDEDGEETAQGKSGGGGKKPARKKKKGLENSDISLSAFSSKAEGSIPDAGEITKFVVMGKELAKEAFGQALENFKTQMKQAKIMAVDLMKGVSDIIQRATPGGGLEAKGNEKITYKYDVEKTAPLFGGMAPG